MSSQVSRLHLRLCVATVVVLITAGVTAHVAGVQAAPQSVAVFPITGSHYNRPTTQISFRGVRRGAIGQLTVIGSRSGRHTGRIAVDSDHGGATFVPSKPSPVGEAVTGVTRLHGLGG